MFASIKLILKNMPILKQIKRSILNWTPAPQKEHFFWRKNINNARYLIQNSAFVQKLLLYFSAPNVIIEISGICNAKCLYCAQGIGSHKTKTTFMKVQVFEEIVKHCLDLHLLGKHNDTVSLYNYGEPFIHPNFDNILNILKKYNLKCAVSSNFIKEPQISTDNYKVIKQVIFSICSLKPDTYKRIYGSALEKVLNNFDNFLSNQKTYSPQTDVKINFIRYKFNKTELEAAKIFFANKLFGSSSGNLPFAAKKRTFEAIGSAKGGGSSPFLSDEYYAYICDNYDLINLCLTGKTEKYDNEAMFKDLEMERFEKIRKSAPKKFFCSLKNMLIITENAQLSLCCAVTSKNKDYELGDFRQFKTKEQIFKAKQKTSSCAICERLHIPYIFACQGIKI